jgi:hypothetical protein
VLAVLLNADRLTMTDCQARFISVDETTTTVNSSEPVVN